MALFTLTILSLKFLPSYPKVFDVNRNLHACRLYLIPMPFQEIIIQLPGLPAEVNFHSVRVYGAMVIVEQCMDITAGDAANLLI